MSIALIVVIVIAVLVAALVGVELYARSEAKDRIAKAANCLTDDSADVSFATMPPLLWQYFNKHYDNLTVVTAGNQIKDAKGMRAEVSIDDINLEGGANKSGTIGSLTATITWTTDGIKQTLNDALSKYIQDYVAENYPLVSSFVSTVNLDDFVQSVKNDPAAGTVTVTGDYGFSVVLKPEKDGNGGLRLVIPPDGIKLTDVPLVGDIELPADTVQSKLDEKTKDITDNSLNIKLDDIKITNDNVVMNFSTKNVDMPTGGSDTCFEGM